MLRAYKYRIYPNAAQTELLNKHFGCVRLVYNWALEHKQTKYQFENVTVSSFELIKLLPVLKKHYAFLREVNSQSLQTAIRNLDTAFKNFFQKKANYPKFKHKHSKQSFKAVQNCNVNFDNNTITLPKLRNIKAKLHRPFSGVIKSVTISKTATGKYYASVLVADFQNQPETQNYTEATTLGIDLGIKNFAVCSDGTVIETPKYLLRAEARLKRYQKALSRKQKGSANRSKARQKLAVLHEQVTNKRNDFLHKLSKKLIDENQAIAFEDLNIKGMVKNHNLAKSITDQSWSKFITYCKYKAAWYGKTIIQCDRFDPTSKLCPVCGSINTKLQLKDRSWTCSCGTVHDRDLNAANNIKTFALTRAGTAQSKACGVDVRPYDEVSPHRKAATAKQEAALFKER